MKLGVVSRIGEFSQENWRGEFETFGKNGQGASHLELISNYPYFGPADYTEEDIGLLKELARKNELKLTIHLLPNQRGLSKELSESIFDSQERTKEFVEHQKKVYSSYNIGALDGRVRRESRKEILRTLEMARKLGVEVITIHGGSYTDDREFPINLERARRTLEEVNPYFTDVKLCVENLPTLGHGNDFIREFPKHIADVLYLTKDLNNVGICLDVGHANVSGRVLSFYEALKKTGKLWDFHLHDNKGDKDDHLQVGEGNVPFRELFEELKRDNYQGTLSIELDTWCRREMQKEERIFALDYLRRLMK